MLARALTPFAIFTLACTSCAVWTRGNPAPTLSAPVSEEVHSEDPEVDAYLRALQARESLLFNPIHESEDRLVDLGAVEKPETWRARERSRTLAFQASHLAGQGRWAEAERLLRQASALDPNSPSLATALAEAMVQQGQWQEGIDHLREALGRQPRLVEGWVLLAQMHQHLNQHREAVEALRRAVELEPRRAQLRFHLASELTEIGDNAAALEELRELADLTAGSVSQQDLHIRGLMVQAQLAQGEGLLDEAVQCYESVISLQPAFIPTYLFLGELRRQAGNTERALETYGRGLLQAPTNPDLNLAVRRLFGTDDTEAYLGWWSDFAAEHPDDVALQRAFAEILRAADQRERATEVLQALAERQPDNFEVQLALGQLLHSAGRNEEALAHLERAITLSPDSPAATAAFFSVLRALGQLEEARDFIDHSVSRQSRAQFYRALGESHERDGNLSAAEEAFREAIRLDPSDPLSRISLIELLNQRGEHPGALEAILSTIQDIGLTLQVDNQSLPVYSYIHAMRGDLSEANRDRVAQIITRVAERENTAAALRALGQMHFDFGHTDRALAALDRARELDASLENRLQIVRVLLANEQSERAEELIRQALEDNPESVPVKLWQGIVQWFQGDHAGAERLWSDSIQQSADLPSVLGTLGAMRAEGWSEAGLALALTTIRRSRAVLQNFNTGPVDLYQFLALFPEALDERFEEVERVLLDAAGEEPDARTWAFLGQFYALLDRPEKAADALRSALRANPDDAEWAAALASLCGDHDLHGVGVELLQEALTHHPDSSELHYYLGFLYNEMDRIADAERALRRAIELDPENYLAINHLSYMFAEEGINLEEALQLARRAVELSDAEVSEDFNNGFIVDSLGWAHHRLGQHEEAIQWLQEAIRRAEAADIHDGVFYDHLGDALHAAGRSEEAIQAWEQALALFREGRTSEDPDDLALIETVCEKILQTDPNRPGIIAILNEVRSQQPAEPVPEPPRE